MPMYDVHEESRGQLGELREQLRPTDAERLVAPGRWDGPAGVPRPGPDQAARLAALLAARAAPFDAPFHAGAEDAAGTPHQ